MQAQEHPREPITKMDSKIPLYKREPEPPTSSGQDAWLQRLARETDLPIELLRKAAADAELWSA